MYRFVSRRPDSLVIFLFVFAYMNSIFREAISSQRWTDHSQDLSMKSYNDKNMKSHPLNERFILLAHHQKQPLESARLSPDNQIFKSQKSSTTAYTTLVIVKTNKSPVLVDYSIGHLSRRLLNEPSSDTDLDTTSEQMSVDDEEKIDGFLQIDDQEFNRKFLLNDFSMDGSGQITDGTTERTSTSTTTAASDQCPTLTNDSRFILTINCTNANATITDILTELEAGFVPYSHQYDVNEFQSACSTGLASANFVIRIFTDNTIRILTILFQTLSRIAESKQIELFSDDKCSNRETVRIIPNSVTSCYLIDLCRLCGTNPPRGQCIPIYNESKCECLGENKNAPSRPYAGDFCCASAPEPIQTSSIPSSSIPIIIGILSGLTGLFGVIICCLWTMVIWRQRNKYDVQVRRLWHLPRAQMPTLVASMTAQIYPNKSVSTSSSQRTDSDFNLSDITDDTFFKDLDQRMGENLHAILASLPSEASSTLSTYDPINELDAIIDNEDIDMIFHDPLTELHEDNETVEFLNSNLNIDL